MIDTYLFAQFLCIFYGFYKVKNKRNTNRKIKKQIKNKISTKEIKTTQHSNNIMNLIISQYDILLVFTKFNSNSYNVQVYIVQNAFYLVTTKQN